MKPEYKKNTGDRVHAAFVNLDQPRKDLWVQSHRQAWNELDKKYSWLDTTFRGEVDRDNCEQVFRDIAEKGVDIVFGNAFDYMSVMMELAEEYPSIVWENASGYQTTRNMAYYQARVHQAMFLAGMIAGKLTETERIGYVGALPIPHAFRQINALTIGANQTNQNVSTSVEFVGAWNEPQAERSATEQLIELDADVIAHMTNTTTPARTAKHNDAWVIGQYVPQKDVAEEQYITSCIQRWSTHYEKEIFAVRNDNWDPDPDWGGIREGYVELDDWGPDVTDEMIEAVDAAKRKYFISDSASIWENTRFKNISDGELYARISSYVDNVSTEIPGRKVRKSVPS
jgi:basic membrane lipoprotein Med (substrate-binding protein (PBP1-ABC) superfamily)